MRRKFIGVVLLGLVLSACGGEGGIYPSTKAYTVRWENYDGTLLEKDNNVKEGDWPSYDGRTPVRPDDEDYTYTFNRWNPSLSKVYSNQTYIATYYRDEKINNYTITFDTRGGSTINPVSVRKGNLLDRPEDPTKDNCAFGGWYTDNALTNEYDFSRPVNSSFTLFAKWNTTEYMVTYNLNYDNLPTVSYSTQDGFITYRPTRSGYVFNGWWLSDGFIDGQPILSRSFSFDTRVTSNNLVLYAEWVEEKMVSNELDAPVVTIDGEYISWNAVENATKYQVIIEKSGIQHVNEQRNYTYIYFPSTLAAGKYTIKVRAIGDSVNYYNSQYTSKTYAHRILTSVTGIKFDENEGTLSWDVVNNATSYELLLDNVTKFTTKTNTYTFDNLYAGNHSVKITATRYDWLSSTGTIKFVIHRLTAPTNLSATLDEETLDYEVTWDEVRMDSGYANSYVVYLNGTKVETISTNKYTIKHNSSYYVDYQVSISVAAYDQNSDYLISPISEELVLDQYFKITYELNGGINNQSNPNSYKKDDIITLQDPTKTGSTFLGWYDNNDVKKEKIALGDGNINLIAKWEAINYVITLDCNGGEPSVYSIEAQYNCEYFLPKPTRDGYSFTGWYDGSKKVSSSGTWKYTSNKTYIAHWAIINYSISYALNDGTNNSSNPSSYTVEDAVTFAEPSKTGYTFLGWFDNNGNQVTSISAGTTGDLTLTAHWNDGDAFIATLDVNGGEVSQTSVNVLYEHSYSLPTPTRLGYTFDGWYDGSTKVNNTDTWKYTSNKTFVAHWTIINYSISYTLNGGTNNPTNPSSYTVEDDVTFAEPSKTGYGFTGWFSEDNAITGIPVGSTGTVNIEARWTANLNNLSVFSEDTSKGTVSIISGNGYSGESITVVATPIDDYAFKGWYHESTRISCEATYTFTMPTNDYSLVAHFFTKAEKKEEEHAQKYGTRPIVSDDGKTITYGLYPQKNVNDSSLISSLNALTAPESNGWYLWGGDYYAKVTATPYGSGETKFDNGTTIVKGTTYWFKCEPITWNILSNANGKYFIASSVLLDAHCYYNSSSWRKDIYGQYIFPNNYAYSDIRTWLNADFYNSAFALGNEYIQTTYVDNSASTANNTSDVYECGNTQDKVFLPSYIDYINSSYGFSTSVDSTDTRCCRTTDWARARGAYYDTSSSFLYNGDYWTRSPVNVANGVRLVRSDGDINHSSNVIYLFKSVRPAIKIKVASL